MILYKVDSWYICIKTVESWYMYKVDIWYMYTHSWYFQQIGMLSISHSSQTSRGWHGGVTRCTQVKLF